MFGPEQLSKKISSALEDSSPKPASTMPLSLRAERALECSEKNQNLPFNSLPPEVLQAVFSEEAESSCRYYARLFRMRNVCKYWMERIDSTPGLWRFISSIYHPELQAMVLRNSKTQTLLVEYTERILENDPSGQKKMQAFASLMRPTASRWHTLNYDPALNSKADITLDELVTVLNSSPSLGYLSLVETSFGPGAEDAQNSFPNKISLPQLNHLDVYQLSVEPLSLLLDRIEAPSLGYFSIEGGYTVDENPKITLGYSSWQAAISERFHYRRAKQKTKHLTSSSQLGPAGECMWLLPKLTKLRLDHQLLRNGGLGDVLRLVKIRKYAEQAEMAKELTINGPPHDIGSSLVKTLCRSIDLVEICPPK
ncbi:hypothetical protein FS837_001929, partial [Tulasnella sp. UAMH 9824]